MEDFVILTKDMNTLPISETCNDVLVACCNSCGFPMGEVNIADGIVICPKCRRFKRVHIRKGKVLVSNPTENEIKKSRLVQYLISMGIAIAIAS